ncbi:MAG: DUF115 domain-containing protein, partial [Candidatus Thermoplasmatota archaeon]|nr:DUF115 domain-containing protein [Candidatus Thermoplasmatota archaeon]
KSFLSSLTEEKVLIAADSALKTLVESDVFPGVVVTDLDGDEKLLLEASQRGAVMVVHAHGDNVQRLVELVPKLEGPVVGTCQVMPPPPLVNWGGYTDGDRAALMALENRAAKIVLAGFDFEKPVAKEGIDMGRKLKKLRWAKEILEWAAMQGAPMVFLESKKK